MFDQVQFPGTTCQVFKALLECLYLRRSPDVHNVDCLALIALANRLCQPQCVALVERTVLYGLTDVFQKGKDVASFALWTLERAQVGGLLL